MVDWDGYRQTPLNYRESGATTDRLPAGYHHFRRTALIGSGRNTFTATAHRILGWQMHRDAGVRVHADAPAAEPGTVVLVSLGPLMGACRVIYVVDEPNRRGFAYGTLLGHPESGEEFFGVRLEPADNTVHAELVAFSRPALWWSKVGSRAALRVQRRITDRYLAAMAPRQH